MINVWVARAGGQHGINEQRLFIRTPLSLRETCAAMPGARWSGKHLAWTLPATTASAGAMAQAFTGMDVRMDSDTRELIASARQVIEAQHTRGAVDLPALPTRTEGWDHQRRAFAFASQLNAAMLAMDMGTGKSLVSIALWEHFEARAVLVLCPVSVVGVWGRELRKHAQDPDEWLIVDPKPGTMTVRKRAELIARGVGLAKASGKRLLIVCNFEAAWRSPLDALLASIQWDDVVADESHRVKSAGGKASKFATMLRSRSRVRGANTGTPMPHSPLDIYAQYRFLDPGIFGTSKNRFMNRYAIQKTRTRGDGKSFEEITGWQNMDEFTQKFRSIAFIVSSEEALPDLPELLPPMERSFDLGYKALRAYAAMERDLIAQIKDDGYMVAANSLTKVMRLRQITSGHAPLDDGTIEVLGDEREKALRDVLEDLPRAPVVVFAVFKHDLAAIARVADEMGLRYGELSGSRKDGLASDATMAKDIDIIGVQLKSGGVGIDLTRASVAIYYSVGYELGDYLQSVKRLHRPGQTRPTTCIHLVADNAKIDRTMYEALAAKRNVIDAIIEAAKQG